MTTMTFKQEQTERKRLFVDMDGTLARFHDEPMYLERMFEKDFFRSLAPFESMVKGLQRFKDAHPEVEIFILSACVDGEPPYCQKEKQAWLDEYLPEINREHRIFTKVGVPKSKYIESGISSSDYLLDDYNVGLEDWQQDGGTAIKAKNNINHKGLNGPLWQGTLVNIMLSPQLVCSQLEKSVCDDKPRSLPSKAHTKER